MEKNTFKKIITLKNNVDEVIDKFENEFKVQIFDSEFVGFFYELMDITIANEYTPEGVDYINWFLNEKFYDKYNPLKEFDNNNNEIMYDEDSLYDYVEKFRKCKSQSKTIVNN